VLSSDAVITNATSWKQNGQIKLSDTGRTRWLGLCHLGTHFLRQSFVLGRTKIRSSVSRLGSDTALIGRIHGITTPSNSLDYFVSTHIQIQGQVRLRVECVADGNYQVSRAHAAFTIDADSNAYDNKDNWMNFLLMTLHSEWTTAASLVNWNGVLRLQKRRVLWDWLSRVIFPL
jgi:hypothetical protein